MAAVKPLIVIVPSVPLQLVGLVKSVVILGGVQPQVFTVTCTFAVFPAHSPLDNTVYVVVLEGVVFIVEP